MTETGTSHGLTGVAWAASEEDDGWVEASVAIERVKHRLCSHESISFWVRGCVSDPFAKTDSGSRGQDPYRDGLGAGPKAA